MVARRRRRVSSVSGSVSSVSGISWVDWVRVVSWVRAVSWDNRAKRDKTVCIAKRENKRAKRQRDRVRSVVLGMT
jgi:hypothetical protein